MCLAICRVHQLLHQLELHELQASSPWVQAMNVTLLPHLVLLTA